MIKSTMVLISIVILLIVGIIRLDLSHREEIKDKNTIIEVKQLQINKMNTVLTHSFI